MTQPTMKIQENIMKLTRNAITEANPALRGRKQHFTIDNAPAATLEAMDDMLTAAGWENDTCPIYDEGVSCGWWIDLSEVDQFKAAYKEAKAGVEKFMSARVVAVQPMVDGRTVRVGQIIEDAKGRAFEVTHIMSMAGYTDVSGYTPGSRELHANRSCRFNTCGNGRLEYGVEATRLIKDLEVTPEAIESAHAQALEDDRTLHAELCSLAMCPAFETIGKDVYSNGLRRRVLDAAHREALSLNDKVDTDLAILRSDIKSFRREHTGARLEEVIDYAIRHTFNRIVQVYGVEIHRNFFADLARTPEQKAFSGGMKTGANTDITTPLRIISDYMQRFMRNNKDAKLSEAKQRLESKIVLLINDGYDEQHLRQALSSATSSHSREAFTSALDMESLK